jgi:hypothetical protein
MLCFRHFNMLKSDADIFFRLPRSAPETSGWFGVLYLLRRDIDLALGIDPNSGASIKYEAIWPGTMAVMAGIDLLAKFYAGNDESGRVRARFLAFLNAFSIGHNTRDQEIIYQLRNSLLHSFGLYSEYHGNVYRFCLRANNVGPLISFHPPDQYTIDLLLLHKQFERSISEYQTQLDSDIGLRANFDAMSPKYGRMHIG